jgi:hypothetical protein
LIILHALGIWYVIPFVVHQKVRLDDITYWVEVDIQNDGLLWSQSDSNKRQWCKCYINGLDDKFYMYSMLIQITYDLEWLVGLKIARKRLQRTKRRWRASDSLGVKGPCLWWRRKYLHLVESPIKLKEVMLWGGSNQYWIIKWKWLDAFGITIHICWMESSHMFKMAMLKQTI